MPRPIRAQGRLRSTRRMTDQSLPEHVAVNRAHWDDDAPNWVAPGERNWRAEPTWGMWDVPLPGLLPDDMTGVRAIELGCGTAYVSAWMARRGANGRRHRQLRTPAGDRPAPRRRARRRPDADPRQCRDRPLPRRFVRLRHLRVRGGDLVRSLRLDSRSTPAAARRGHACLPRHVDAGHAVLADRWIATDHHQPRARLLHDPPTRLAHRSRRSGRHRVQPAAVGLVPTVP